MILIFTHATHHFAEQLSADCSAITLKQFCDGELYVKINYPIKNENIALVAATPAPANNLVELFLVLDALKRAQPKNITLFFTYFGYARQCHPQAGEAHSSKLICSIIKQFFPLTVHILHAHAHDSLQTLLPFTHHIPLDFFCAVAQKYDAIAAPDQGAWHLAQTIATMLKKEALLLRKERPQQDRVCITAVQGSAQNKKVLLVDDIISTGRTIIKAANSLIDVGARSVAAAATHGIISQQTYERLEKSNLEKVYITNSINNQAAGKIIVIDISLFIESLKKAS